MHEIKLKRKEIPVVFDNFEFHTLTKRQKELGRKYQCDDCKGLFDEIWTDFKITEKPYFKVEGGNFLCQTCFEIRKKASEKNV